MFKPMLAAKCEDPEALRFPVLATPKIDGIRCTVQGGKALTRSLKEIPNRYIQRLVSQLPEGLDGELTVGNKFQDCTSGIMSHEGEPDFRFWVFDFFGAFNAPYTDRVNHTIQQVTNAGFFWLRGLKPTECKTLLDLQTFYDFYLSHGAEGICFRTPDSPYKQGRSTFQEQYLIKWKQYETDEAVIIGYEELRHNNNTPIINSLGLQERSSHQSNLIPMNMLGAIVVQSKKFPVTFKIGTGFDLATRTALWTCKESLIGRLISYKYHSYGIKDAPRCPVFNGFRSPLDL